MVRETRRGVSVPQILALCLVTASCVAVGAPDAPAAEARLEFADGGAATRVETLLGNGETYFLLADIARAVAGVRHYNPSTGKVTLVVGSHRIAMVPGSRFVAFDRSVENISLPLLYRGGSFWVPPGFLTRVLARALNASVEWDRAEGLVSILEFGPVVSSVEVEERSGGDAVATFTLSEATDFSAESTVIESVEVFIADATLADSAASYGGAGHISAVSVWETDRGVRAAIAVSAGAGAYRARILANPPRLEVVVTSASRDASPQLELRAGRSLSADRSVDPGRLEGGIETVMIDPGGGGRELGPEGRGGAAGKDVTLALARALSAALQREGFHAFMTRSSDTGVPIRRRSEIANLTEADVFVSLECDAWQSGWARGFRVSYYEPALTDRGDRRRGRGGGLPREYEGPPERAADDLMWNRAQEDFLAESRVLARAVHASMEERLPLRDRGVGRRTLAVLSGCAMPAIRVDLGFISNGEEETLLTDDRFLRDAARAIARGIVEYRSRAEGRMQ